MPRWFGLTFRPNSCDTYARISLAVGPWGRASTAFKTASRTATVLTCPPPRAPGSPPAGAVAAELPLRRLSVLSPLLPNSVSTRSAISSYEDARGKNPFWIDKLTPIQIATFDLDDYRNVRGQFTTDEWINLMVRSIGYEPGEMSRRLKLLFLVRLIPLAERNYNLVELGPRGTGKSYVVQEVSPYTALLTGGTTVANLFGHMSGRQ
jgi:uncharacterized protein (TIGR02688 family)